VAAFGGVRANLAAGGVCVFDVNTLATCRAVYSSLLVQPHEDCVLVLEGRTAPDLEPGGAGEIWIDRLSPEAGGWWRRDRTVTITAITRPSGSRAA